jgi:hypothetical protein
MMAPDIACAVQMAAMSSPRGGRKRNASPQQVHKPKFAGFRPQSPKVIVNFDATECHIRKRQAAPLDRPKIDARRRRRADAARSLFAS